MALTTEQQNQLEFNVALMEQNAVTEAARHAREDAIESRRNRLEAIRLAKETLIETSRSKPVDQRDIAAADIVSFATALETHINGQ